MIYQNKADHPLCYYWDYPGALSLTQLPQGKMAAMLEEDIFRCIFVNEKFCILIEKVCSLGSNCQQPSIGLDNGLVPNRRQAIIWIYADPIHWHP